MAEVAVNGQTRGSRALFWRKERHTLSYMHVFCAFRKHKRGLLRMNKVSTTFPWCLASNTYWLPLVLIEIVQDPGTHLPDKSHPWRNTFWAASSPAMLSCIWEAFLLGPSCSSRRLLIYACMELDFLDSWSWCWDWRFTFWIWPVWCLQIAWLKKGSKASSAPPLLRAQRHNNSSGILRPVTSS